MAYKKIKSQLRFALFLNIRDKTPDFVHESEKLVRERKATYEANTGRLAWVKLGRLTSDGSFASM